MQYIETTFNKILLLLLLHLHTPSGGLKQKTSGFLPKATHSVHGRGEIWTPEEKGSNSFTWISVLMSEHEMCIS